MVRKSKIRKFANEIMQIIRHLNDFSFAGSFAEMPTFKRAGSPACLQVQMGFSTVCKEKTTNNQAINKFLFAALFAKISN